MASSRNWWDDVTVNDAENTQNSSSQPLQERVNNRSQRPTSDAFKAFMASNWAPAPQVTPARDAVADHAARRRRTISELFKGERLVVPAGPLKVRSNDCDYRFRPHSGFAHPPAWASTTSPTPY